MKIQKPHIAIIFTVLTIIGAQVSISIPLSPVPFLLSDFFIILGALYLGRKWAVFFTFLYLLLGAMGLPVFSEGGGGLAYFKGSTGGYLIGFLIAAYIIGAISERDPQKISKDLLAWFAGASAIFICGVIGLVFFAGLEITEAIKAGFIPFIPGAVTKGFVAVGTVQILRKCDF